MTMKRALIIGASRGIGRAISLKLADNGYSVGLAARTMESSPKYPGSINELQKYILSKGGKAISLPCNVRHADQLTEAIENYVSQENGVDIFVYNSGAVWWDTVENTPTKRFDLLMEVNVRGAYVALQAILRHMRKAKHGRIILVAPPIYSRFVQGKTAYAISKMGMTILMLGLAHELKNSGISIATLWPAKAVQAHVTDVQKIPLKLLRKPEIFADAVQVFASLTADKAQKYNGRALIDEDFLRENGVDCFDRYRCDANSEPPRMMPTSFPDLAVQEQAQSLSQSSKL